MSKFQVGDVVRAPNGYEARVESFDGINRYLLPPTLGSAGPSNWWHEDNLTMVRLAGQVMPPEPAPKFKLYDRILVGDFAGGRPGVIVRHPEGSLSASSNYWGILFDDADEVEWKSVSILRYPPEKVTVYLFRDSGRICADVEEVVGSVAVELEVPEALRK